MIKESPGRKFGEYDGLEPGQEVPGEGIWQAIGAYDQMPLGYERQKVSRCTDRFVRYPYPKMLNSNYKVCFSPKHKEAKFIDPKHVFNLEKETKIINPHKMEKKSNHKLTYRGEKGYPPEPRKQKAPEMAKPIVQMSSYMASFPDW